MTETRFEQCIRQMNEGDKDGLRCIYEEYVSYIYGIVWQMLRSRENAEDVTSEFFIKLWDRSDSYRPGGGHKGWMATIARNMAVDYLRRHKKEELTSLLSGAEEDTDEYRKASAVNRAALGGGNGAADSDISHSDVESSIIEEMTISEALGKLKESERIIVHMKILGELTFKEIAAALHMPMGTVTWRYREAMNKLRRCGYEETL